jgi:hypothetical protein
MRVLTPVIEVATLTVFHARQYLTLRRAVAFELIRDNHPWDILTAFEQLAEELLRGLFVAPALHQDIEDGIPLALTLMSMIVCFTSGKQPRLR